MPTVEELLSLDLLTLREHTERAGDRLDADVHAARIRESLAISSVCEVRRNGGLVAYALLNRLSGSSWFVRGFNIHPGHRNAAVFRELFQQLNVVALREGISELRSHVYKTNLPSMAFHRRLGFRVTKENDKGVEFHAGVDDLLSNASVEGSLDRRRGRPSDDGR